MQTKYFRVNRKEYCHVSDDAVFIINSKEVRRVPLEHDLNEAWGIVSIFNYLLFIFLFLYVGGSLNVKSAAFFYYPANYGALFLLIISFIRVKEGFITSRTPTVYRKNIRSVYFKTPTFSFARLVIYFEAPDGKVLRRTIPVLYKQEALPVLKEAGVLK